MANVRLFHVGQTFCTLKDLELAKHAEALFS